MPDLLTFKALLKGSLTYLPGVSTILETKKQDSKHSGSQAEFCYALWLGILTHLHDLNIRPVFTNVGEIGSGGSLGAGICALLTGSEKYYTLEYDSAFNKKQNLEILEQLVHLFRSHAVIPTKFKQLNIVINNHDFPETLIKPYFLEDERIDEIRQDILNGFEKAKRVIVIRNWEKAPDLNLDFIFSRAVMEHVNDPEYVYKSIHRHLKAGSCMFHDIEYHSHGLTRKLNGHYMISGTHWKIICGRRKYFLNRWTETDHLNSIKINGYALINASQRLIYDKVSGKEVLFGGTVTATKQP